MKKFLITIAPLCMLSFALMWFLWGLKGAFAFFWCSTVRCCFGTWACEVDGVRR